MGSPDPSVCVERDLDRKVDWPITTAGDGAERPQLCEDAEGESGKGMCADKLLLRYSEVLWWVAKNRRKAPNNPLCVILTPITLSPYNRLCSR